MVYVVRWVPVGPEISASFETATDAVALTDELMAAGRTAEITILKDGHAFDPTALRAESRKEDPLS